MYTNSVQVQVYLGFWVWGESLGQGEEEEGGLGDDSQEIFGILGPSRLLLMQVKSGGGREASPSPLVEPWSLSGPPQCNILLVAYQSW